MDLTQVLRTLGQDRCAAILADTLQCEDGSGMLTQDGTRRRTRGGVFFPCVQDRPPWQAHRPLFPQLASPHGQGQRQSQGQPPALTWDEARSLMQTLATASLERYAP